MAYKDAHQQQKTANASEAGSPLLELARLLARLAARKAFERAAASHFETSGCLHSEPEDACEAEA